MSDQYGMNIYDFDIYSKRISFFYNKRDKIGTFLGLILTFLYVIITLVLFFYYSIQTIRRIDVKSHESTYYSQEQLSININPDLFYIAFGLENPTSLSRFIDEEIYSPKVYFIKQKKEDGVFITKHNVSLNIDKCDAHKFGDNYKNQFIYRELNNSYCLKNFNLTLLGGSNFEETSFIKIKIHPCVNTTENNNHCKPQDVIDSHLTSGYFSISIKDIGLNPLNYSFPIIPIIQNLKTNVDITMCRESLIYMGITEIQTDVGLLENNIKKEHYLQYRKYSQSFFFIKTQDYHAGKEVFSLEIKLEGNIRVQKREYTKMSEVFSITGGYMQLISTIFALINLYTKNLCAEIKILNKLFNFNLKQRKIILSIQYEKTINYNAQIKNNSSMKYSIPYKARKSLNPYQSINQLNFRKNSKKDNTKKKKEHEHYVRKFNSQKNNNIKYLNNNILTFNKKSNIHKPKLSISTKQCFNNVSKLLMLKEEEMERSHIVKLYENESRKGIFPRNNVELKRNETELLNSLDFNIFDYLCCNGKLRDKTTTIELFNYGINFYRNQMNIINIFNIIFLTQVMLNHHTFTKNNFFNRIVEIPIKSK